MMKLPKSKCEWLALLSPALKSTDTAAASSQALRIITTSELRK